MAEDVEIVVWRGTKTSCCRSYASPKGRCYTCPEDDEEELESEEE